MEAEAAKAAAEAEAAAAPTEKDMINDIRENRRRERRQVTFSLVYSMFRCFDTLFSISHYFFNDWSWSIQSVLQFYLRRWLGANWSGKYDFAQNGGFLL